ncbi:TPA: hypothetical protein ACOELQ_001993 [Enterobacter mori]
MITLLVDLIKSGLSFFQKKQEKEISGEVITTQETNETNREDIKKTGFSARSWLIITCCVILAFGYVFAPIVDGFLGIPLFQMSLDPIFKLLMALVVGS